MSRALEERSAEDYRQRALADTRKDYPKYFEALAEHPRLLVGQRVPRIGAEGEEVLRDSADAKEWQEAVKQVLLQEVQQRGAKLAEAGGNTMVQLHQAVELFQNNPDLIPGTKSFDYELAQRFAELAQPYEHRVDGKLRGYSVPVQPLVTHLRGVLAKERTAKPAAQAAPPPAAPPKPVAPAKPAEAPQAGIPARAGSSAADEQDFSTLFGTLGLPNLQI